MRKNVKSEKVIRAMAIGISAMLMASSPLTALAAEPGEGSDDNNNDSIQEEKPAGVCDEAQAAAKSAEAQVKAAEADAETVKRDVAQNVEAGEAGTDSKGKDLAQAVIDAAENVENVNAEDVNAEDGTPLADAKTAIGNTNTQLDVAEANDELSDAALDEAKDAADDASTIASDMKDAMDEAETKVDEQLNEIKNATTTTDANAAYDELEETAKKAEEDFNTKLEAYDEAKKNYEDAAKLVADAEAKYNKAIETADANATAAAAELDAAKKNAEALESAVIAAKNAVDASSKDAMEIADLEDETRKDGGLNWKNEDKLFIAIMEKYYLPELMGIEGATVTRIQGKDNNEYNYFTAVYKDENGEEQTKYYNFKMDNGSKDDIVIFEKREVEIFGDPNETPDQYVKDNNEVVDVKTVNEGLVKETIVDVDGTKVIKNDMTDSETLVSDSVVTGTSKEDIFVDEENDQESWQYDAETGELVKTVKAEVTTITYTDATFTSDKSYATDAERDEEAAKKEAELEEATGKDATVKKTDETTYTYTASGTYIPTFTKTVKVNKEYESGYLWKQADSKEEAEDKAFDMAKDKIDDDLGDYYLIGDIKSDLSVTMTEEETETYKIFGKKHTIVTDDADYLVTGTVTATYAKVTKKTVSQSTFGSLWDDIQVLIKGGQSTNEKLEETARKAVEAEGGIFVSADWADWKFNKATIRYVAGVKVTTGEEETKQDAEGAVEAAAREQAIANGATGVYNVKTTGTNTIDHTTYSYTVDYLKEDTKTTETKEIATETYGNAEALTGEIIQNKNYYDAINNGETDKDKILLTQKEDNYRAFVDNAKNLTAKYERLYDEAQKANAAVKDAQDMVDALQGEIEDLKKRTSNLGSLKDLESKLAIAKDNRDKAEETLKDILDKLNDAEIELEETIARLTPAPTGGEGTDDTTDDTETTVTTPVVLATVPAATVNVVAPAPVAQPEVVEIEEEVTPLAPAVEENKQEETKAEPESQETIQLDDEETPLADIIVEDEQTKMSWWWLLIVALLGATGYEMYKKHNEKKQKVQAENAEDAE